MCWRDNVHNMSLGYPYSLLLGSSTENSRLCCHIILRVVIFTAVLPLEKRRFFSVQVMWWYLSFPPWSRDAIWRWAFMRVFCCCVWFWNSRSKNSRRHILRKACLNSGILPEFRHTLQKMWRRQFFDLEFLQNTNQQNTLKISTSVIGAPRSRMERENSPNLFWISMQQKNSVPTAKIIKRLKTTKKVW